MKNMKRISTREAVEQFLLIEDAPKKADLVFVMGSEYFPKMDIAIDLYRRGFVPKIFISGGAYQGKKRAISESEEFAQYAIDKGMKPVDIFLEKKSTNTLENLVFSRPIISKKIGWKNIKSIIFVCHAFHARRVLMTATKHWPKGIEYRFSPVVDARQITVGNWWKNKKARLRVFDELRRIGEYTVKGDLSDEQ